MTLIVTYLLNYLFGLDLSGYYVFLNNYDLGNRKFCVEITQPFNLLSLK